MSRRQAVRGAGSFAAIPAAEGECMTALVQRVRERAVQEAALRKESLRPVASPEEASAAESALGMAFEETYRLVLLRVANGGFGPAQGLLGVPSEQVAADLDAVEAYRRHAAQEDWPLALAPVVYLGAECYYGVECRGPGRVVEYNPDFWDLQERDFSPAHWQARAYPDHPTAGCFRVVAPSFAALLEAWVAGRHW